MARQLCCRGMCKICCYLMASSGIGARRSFHRISIAGKKPLVKRSTFPLDARICKWARLWWISWVNYTWIIFNLLIVFKWGVLNSCTWITFDDFCVVWLTLFKTLLSITSLFHYHDWQLCKTFMKFGAFSYFRPLQFFRKAKYYSWSNLWSYAQTYDTL